VDSYEGKFSIDRYTGVIWTSASLDREQRSEYQLTVTAADRGLVALSSTARVTVRVDDANDNAPQFQRLSYVAQIRSDIAPGQLCCLSFVSTRRCRCQCKSQFI